MSEVAPQQPPFCFSVDCELNVGEKKLGNVLGQHLLSSTSPLKTDRADHQLKLTVCIWDCFNLSQILPFHSDSLAGLQNIKEKNGTLGCVWRGVRDRIEGKKCSRIILVSSSFPNSFLFCLLPGNPVGLSD